MPSKDKFLLTKYQQKILAIVSCYLSDVTLVAWVYYISTNYHYYNERIKNKVASPDFQLQFYQIMLQSLTFALLLFLVAQTLVYILGFRGLRSAYFYLKYFSVLGFAVSAFIVYSANLYAILPAVFYIFGYITFSKLFKESTAAMQNLPQSSKLL